MQIRTCALLISGMILITGSALARTAPQIVTLQSATQGTVIFHHEEHLSAVNGCNDCHHMGLSAGACRSCHGVNRLIPRLKQAFHRQCRNCHIKTSGPTECAGCHHS